MEVPLITLSRAGWMFPHLVKEQDRDATAAFAATHVLAIQKKRVQYNAKCPRYPADLLAPEMIRHAETALRVHQASMAAASSE